MLREIRCERFRAKAVTFHDGLNVVLGDENATNSIGKSSLLMVVDFVLGGRSFLTHNTDVIQELGHHRYDFRFEFDDEEFRFRRDTVDDGDIYRCDSEYNPIEAISLSQFTAWLKTCYGLGHLDLSFRALVSLYARIWGKRNLDVHKPLHAVPNQSAADCVNDLMKTFGRFDEIRAARLRVQGQETQMAARTAAVRAAILPKVRKAEYQENTVRIAKMEGELASIKADVAQYATNLSDLVSREVLDLKLEKDNLIRLRTVLEGRLRRARRELKGNRHIKSKHFAGLLELFPEIDAQRLAGIEEFHSGLSKALGSELREAARAAEADLKRVAEAIDGIDEQMRTVLNAIDEPTHLVDRVYTVAKELEKAREENQVYEGEVELRRSLAVLREELSKVRRRILIEIESALNLGMSAIVADVFGPERKSPTISLDERQYEFEVFEDTGTGTAFAALLVFDLTVLQETALPMVIHDSVLFKNVENDSIARLIEVYPRTGQQSFVAIDEVEKYGPEAAALLRERAVIKLDDDNLLYDKDWRVGG